MMKIISQKPGSFEVYRKFSPVAVKRVISSVKNNIESVRNNEFSELKALYIARDIEQSVIERKFTEIVKTRNIEYQNLEKEIISQTREHRNSIDKRILELNKHN